MFKVFVNDGSEMPSDDIFYIIAKDGIFLKKKIGIVESIAPVDKISILEKIEPFAKLYINKIPINVFGKVVAFFREVYNKYKSESVILLYYNQTKKKYIIHVPEQEVSSASIDYKNEIVNYRDYNLIGTIHSHANFGAFHSSTDSFDEKHFDGIHITIGNVNNEEVSISSSLVVNGERFKVEPEEYIEKIEKKDDKLSNSIFKGFSKHSNKSDKYIFNEMPKDKSFLRRWLTYVKEKKYISAYSGILEGDYFPYYQYGFEYMMLPSLNEKVDNIGETDVKIEDKKIDKFDEDNDDFNPCLTCIYRDYKIDLLMEELSKGIEEPEEETMDINYKSIYESHYFKSLKEKENHK